MKPPLTIKEYFFPYVQIAADPEFSPDDNDDECITDLQTKVSIEKSPENDTYQVSLEISALPENEENRIPYSIQLVAIGMFSVDADRDDIDKLLNISAPSILYSSAREFIITITSRGPWAAAILPTVSFSLPQKKNLKKTTKGK